MAFDIEKELKYKSGFYKKSTIDEFKYAIRLFKEANIYFHRIDYLLDGDDGEESFEDSLKQDLKELNEYKDVKSEKTECGQCTGYDKYTKKCSWKGATKNEEGQCDYFEHVAEEKD